MKIDKKQFRKWIVALRSGKYKQTREGALQDEFGFCCLGVACDVLIPDKKKHLSLYGYLSGNYPASQSYSPGWLKDINKDFARKIDSHNLADLNDVVKLSFNEIADMLELVYEHGAFDV